MSRIDRSLNELFDCGDVASVRNEAALNVCRLRPLHVRQIAFYIRRDGTSAGRRLNASRLNLVGVGLSTSRLGRTTGPVDRRAIRKRTADVWKKPADIRESTDRRLLLLLLVVMLARARLLVQPMYCLRRFDGKIILVQTIRLIDECGDPPLPRIPANARKFTRGKLLRNMRNRNRAGHTK